MRVNTSTTCVQAHWCWRIRREICVTVKQICATLKIGMTPVTRIRNTTSNLNGTKRHEVLKNTNQFDAQGPQHTPSMDTYDFHAQRSRTQKQLYAHGLREDHNVILCIQRSLATMPRPGVGSFFDQIPTVKHGWPKNGTGCDGKRHSEETICKLPSPPRGTNQAAPIPKIPE